MVLLLASSLAAAFTCAELPHLERVIPPPLPETILDHGGIDAAVTRTHIGTDGRVTRGRQRLILEGLVPKRTERLYAVVPTWTVDADGVAHLAGNRLSDVAVYVDGVRLVRSPLR